MQKKSMCMYVSIDINKHCGLANSNITGQLCKLICKGSQVLMCYDSFFYENYN